MIGAVPNGTSCKAVVKIWKRTASGRVPLKGNRIEIGEQLTRNGIFSEVGYGTTNSRGRTVIDFVWSTDSCAYNSFLGDAETFSLGLSELVIFDDLIQFPEACQGDV